VLYNGIEHFLSTVLAGRIQDGDAIKMKWLLSSDVTVRTCPSTAIDRLHPTQNANAKVLIVARRGIN
jgi:hypothetical protein